MKNYNNKIERYVLEIENITPYCIDEDNLSFDKSNLDSFGYDSLDFGEANFDKNLYRTKISGTSIAGIFRNMLIDNDPNKVSDIIFSQKKEFENIELCIEDSYSNDFELNNLVKQDRRFKINRKTNTRDLTKMSSQYVLKKGQKFQVEIELKKMNKSIFDLSEYDLQNQNSIDEKNFNFVIMELEKFIKQINNGEVRIGAQTSNSFGIFKVKNIGRKNYNFSIAEDLKSYRDKKNLKLIEFKDLIQKNELGYKVFMSCPDGMKILKNKEKENIIKASFIRGILRNNCQMISDSILDCQNVVDSMFGTVNQQAKILFEDLEIDFGKFELKEKQRININRLTQNAMSDGIIEDTLITWNDPILWKFDLSKIPNSEIVIAEQLLLWSFKNIIDGTLKFGGATAAGYGQMKVEKIEKYNTLKPENNKLIYQEEEI